jgi:hypothetical protein
MGNIQSLHNNNITFKFITDKNEANLLLSNAENKDFYLSECYDDTINSKARKNMTYSPNISNDRDKKIVLNFLENIRSELPARLCSDLNEVNIIELMPTADGGMPHTRPDNIICYPNLSQLFSKTTLIHELWHLHQRKHNEFWLKIFKKLGWTPWDGTLPQHLENNRRFNPDTIDYPLFIYQNKWVPIPIFKDISKPNVSQVEIWFYNVEKKYHVKQIPSEIVSFFPNLPESAYEHPREITAYILSEPNRYYSSLSFKELIELLGDISIRTIENKKI